MTQYVFGSGFLVCKRTDIAATPVLLGTLQEVSLDFDRKIETLLGQFNMAVAAAGGEFKISGKAKSARFQASLLNNLFLGQTLTSGTMLEMATAEQHTVASGGFAVTNSGTFTEDLGAFYVSGGGALVSVTSSPAEGQYSVSGGEYTVNSGDNGVAVNAYYNYTVSGGGFEISMANQLMGPLPTFELNLKETFNFNGQQKDIIVKLNACVSPKLSLPFSNAKFAIQEFDFQALADASNNIGTISITE